MKARRRLLNSLIIIFILNLFGCSYNNIFEIDKNKNGVEEKIFGIKNLYANGAKNVNILFIHGMGHHPIDEEMGITGVTRLYQNKIAQKLGFDQNQNGYKEFKKEPLTLKHSSIIGGYLIRRIFKKANGTTLNLFALSWDEATVKIQRSLLQLDKDFYETVGSKNRELYRVGLNRQLKRFINRSFADPAIYLGSFGEQIRYVVAQGLTKIDTILRENQYTNDSLSNQIVLVSDSLGSSIIFDTIKKITKPDYDKSYERFSARDVASAKQFAGLTKLIFMNANQLPLIELGRIKGPAKGETEDKWLKKYPCHKVSELGGIVSFNSTRNSYMAEKLASMPLQELPKLQVVAFTDPNDALSYYLTDEFKKRCNDRNSIKIINVLLTNAHWNYFFLLAHPGKAHASGFKTNNKAIKIVVNGAN